MDNLDIAREVEYAATMVRRAIYHGGRTRIAKAKAKLDAACAAWLALSDPKAIR
jgi:hypothetical protein